MRALTTDVLRVRLPEALAVGSLESGRLRGRGGGDMATETDADAAEARSSRRKLLAGLAAGAGIVTAETLVQVKPALAGSDGYVVLGVDIQLTAGTTGVSSNAVTVLHGRGT